MAHTQSATDLIHSIIASTSKDLENATAQLRMINSASCLERCNSICVFPATGLTITTDHENKMVITGHLFATQFEPATARKIVANVKNGNGESPVIMSPKQYYQLQVDLLTENLATFQDLAAKA